MASNASCFELGMNTWKYSRLSIEFWNPLRVFDTFSRKKLVVIQCMPFASCYSCSYEKKKNEVWNYKKFCASLVVAINSPSPQSQTQTSGTTLILGQSSNLEWPWEERITKNGERYYINHLTRTTHWRDPRLCMLIFTFMLLLTKKNTPKNILSLPLSYILLSFGVVRVTIIL